MNKSYYIQLKQKKKRPKVIPQAVFLGLLNVLLRQEVIEETVQFLIKALHKALAEQGVVLIKEHEFSYGLTVIIHQDK